LGAFLVAFESIFTESFSLAIISLESVRARYGSDRNGLYLYIPRSISREFCIFLPVCTFDAWFIFKFSQIFLVLPVLSFVFWGFAIWVWGISRSVSQLELRVLIYSFPRDTIARLICVPIVVWSAYAIAYEWFVLAILLSHIWFSALLAHCPTLRSCLWDRKFPSKNSHVIYINIV